MIFVQTLLSVADNSGAQIVRCIRCYTKLKYGLPLDDVLVSIRTYLPHKRIRKGRLFRGIIVRTGRWLQIYQKAAWFKFNQNSVILLNKRRLPLGSRFIGPIPQGIRKKRYTRLIALAPLSF